MASEKNSQSMTEEFPSSSQGSGAINEHLPAYSAVKDKSSPPLSGVEVLTEPSPPCALPGASTEAKSKENDLELLKYYDTIIIVDDSASMWDHWHHVRKALSDLAREACKFDTDGISIRFMNYDTTLRGKISFPLGSIAHFFGLDSRSRDHIKSEPAVKRLFDKVKPCGFTPLAKCLQRVTEKVLSDYKKGRGKKTNCLVITDGIPDDAKQVENVITDVAEQLYKSSAPISHFGIQFVQIGQDRQATEFLKRLDQLKANLEGREIHDIVDTEPYTDGDMTGDLLIKVLLGGINRKIDNQQTAKPSA